MQIHGLQDALPLRLSWYGKDWLTVVFVFLEVWVSWELGQQWLFLQTNGLNYLLYFNLVVSFHILGLLSFQTNKMAKKKSFRVVMRRLGLWGQLNIILHSTTLEKWLAFLLWVAGVMLDPGEEWLVAICLSLPLRTPITALELSTW